MPGLVGYAGRDPSGGFPSLLHAMANALQHEDRYRLELHDEGTFGLGRVSLGFINPSPQPQWNDERTTCVVMEGEFYGDGPRRAAAPTGTSDGNADCPAALALRLYEEQGDAFAAELNGSFVIALYDRSRARLLITNDRLGLFPLYYAPVGERFLFASGVRALLAEPRLPRVVDPLALVQSLIFDHPLEDRTSLAGVRALAPGSVLTVANGRLDLRPYWTIRYGHDGGSAGEEEYIAELLLRVRQAVRRQWADGLSAGLFLSGGLDSRLLQAVLRDEGLAPRVTCFSFGIPRCDDARWAGEVATRTGARFHFSALRPDYLVQDASTAVRLTDGASNCVHLHAFANLAQQAPLAQVVYKGLDGGLFGAGLTRELWAEGHARTVAQSHLRALAHHGVLVFPPDELTALFPSKAGELVDAALAAFAAALTQCDSPLLADQQHYFRMRYRVPRLTLMGVELVRSRMEVRLPLCDRDVVSFMLRVPPGLQIDRHVVVQALARTAPDLAKVPSTETGLPLIPCGRDLLLRANTQVRWRLRAAGLSWVAVPQRRPYADYDAWMRTALRGWVEELLLGAHSRVNSLFDADAVRRLVERHMAGANHAKQLGALLTIELWHRQVFG